MGTHPETFISQQLDLECYELSDPGIFSQAQILQGQLGGLGGRSRGNEGRKGGRVRLTWNCCPPCGWLSQSLEWGTGEIRCLTWVPLGLLG